MTAESLGWQLRSALPPMRLHSVSLYNNDADVLWLSEGALGPDEHNVVVEAIEHLKNEKGTLYEEFGMEDGRIAIFLGIRGPRGELVGTVMILADMKSLSDGTMERVLTVPVKTLMQKMAVFLRKQHPQAAGEMGVVTQIPPPAPAEAKVAPPAAPVATPKNLPPQSETLAPKQVDAILTLELVAEPAPPKAVEKPKGPVPAATPAPPPVAARPAPIVKAVPKKTPPLQAAPAVKGPTAVPPRVQSAPPIAAPAPPRDIEVLPFDADISITQARRALPASTAPVASAADVEVLPFDDNIQIPTAHPASAASAPGTEIEVLDFDAELTMPPTKVQITQADVLAVAKAAPHVEPPVARAAPTAKAAPAFVEPPVAKAAPAQTHSEPPVAKGVTAAHVEPPVAKVASINDALAKAAPVIEPPVAKAAPAPEPPVARAAPPAPAAKAPAAPVVGAKPAAAPASNKSPSATPAPTTSTKPAATPATVSIPVINPGSTTTSARAPKSADDEVLLIQDTGPVKKLELRDEPSIEPPMPPPPPLTAEETATDLSLFVQELIKLRSNGRTRRYEVLARSQRDANRNEVPTAFIAETAKGREGAALDALVVERLLQWLGEHGETIWDSEPASFSVNLSLGALEDEQFPEKIGNWLKQYNVEAEYVGFEVSEFACVQSRAAVQRFVDAVEKLGCFLVIDNFSFDSNMFEFLGSKALRHVKIDPKLTTAAMKEKLPQALVVAILQACKVLGVHCVAKRIESQSSLQWLTAVGCDFAQSFQLEKPTAIESLVSGKAIKALRE